MDIKVPQPTETLILVADDDLPTRQLLARMLKMEGYRVEMAVDGNEALEKYASLHPNLMLVDALMPQTNGFEVCAKLKAEPDGIPIPIVMITALNDQDSMIRAFEAGAADYTTKPVYWPVLRQRIRRLLLGKEIENELRREQAFASTVLDSVDAVLIVLNSEGRFVQRPLNQAQWMQRLVLCAAHFRSLCPVANGEFSAAERANILALSCNQQPRPQTPESSSPGH